MLITINLKKLAILL